MLHHGFTFSATVWLVLPREQGLPYILHDAGTYGTACHGQDVLRSTL